LEGVPSLVLVNRTMDKAVDLAVRLRALPQAAETEIRVVGWEDREKEAAVAGADLLVNGTSLGMKREDPPLFPPAWLSDRHVVFDMVYAGGSGAALPTAAREGGALYVDGMEMLLHQGFLSFRHWFGDPVPEKEMRAGLMQALGKKEGRGGG
jgi:shikimate dehydrogenase